MLSNIDRMQAPLSFRAGAAFNFATNLDEALSGLAPAIEFAAAHIKKTRSMRVVARDMLRHFPDAERYFSLRDVSADRLLSVRNRLIYPKEKVRAIRVEQRALGTAFEYRPKTDDETREFARLLMLVGEGVTRRVLKRRAPSSESLLELLMTRGVVHEEQPAQRASFHAPGLYRLQHASLLFRSSTTGVLIDPHLHSVFEPDESSSTITRADLEGLVDAIVISHSHRDHFHLPSIAQFPRSTTVIVPRVRRGSILAEDMAKAVRELGFTRVETPEWYSPPTLVGDIEVHPLPFYGEQPLLYERGLRADVRNWGNTYVLRSPSMSSWILIDSGNDAEGTMTDVAVEVRRRFGRLDILQSNLGAFTLRNPFCIAGAGKYWLSLSPDQMLRFSSMKNHCVTLAVDGVAQVARIVEPRFFLPYAHWWRDVGAPPHRGECKLMEMLESALQGHVSTKVVSWRVGDGASLRKNQLRIEHGYRTS